MPHILRISEPATCNQMIDPELEKAGWYLSLHQNYINSNIRVSAYGARVLKADLDAIRAGSGVQR